MAAVFTFHEFFINNGRTGWVVYFGLVILFFMQQAMTQLNSKTHKALYLEIVFRSMLLGTITILLLAIIIYNLSPSFHNRVSLLVPDFLSQHSQQINTSETPPHKPDLRISFFKYSLRLIREHPIMGLGTASFESVYKKSPGVPGWQDLNNPHDEYLLMFVQGGLVGLCILLYFFYTQWYVSFRLGDERQIAQALILSGIISCFFNSFLYTSVTGHFYVLFLSLLLSRYSPAKSVRKKTLLNRGTP